LATIGYEELPVPAGGDAPTVPGHIAALAEAIDPHLVHDVVDAADRSTRFSDAPLSTLCIAADGTTWVKTDAATDTWATLWEPVPAWREITTLATGFEPGLTVPEIRRIGNQVWTRGRVQLTTGDPIPGNTTVLGTVPIDCRPSQLSFIPGGASITGDPITGLGRVEVGTSGNITFYSQDGTGTAWVDISGFYWLD
jgi:hypothetical protein